MEMVQSRTFSRSGTILFPLLRPRLLWRSAVRAAAGGTQNKRPPPPGGTQNKCSAFFCVYAKRAVKQPNFPSLRLLWRFLRHPCGHALDPLRGSTELFSAFACKGRSFVIG